MKMKSGKFNYKKMWAVALGISLPTMAGMLGVDFMCNAYNENRAAVPRATAEDIANADYIVVLTGHRGRLSKALELCKQDSKLFISGCAPGATWKSLMIADGFNTRKLRMSVSNIDLGKDALDTVGNALEIKSWLKDNPHIGSIVVVTSESHLPRVQQAFKGHGLYDLGVEIHFETPEDKLDYLFIPREIRNVGYQKFRGLEDGPHLRSESSAPQTETQQQSPTALALQNP